MKKVWWQEKVAYQIYPKSFYDTNGDGVGDLRGIIEKLDYLKDLGVDIVWISPCYQSPLADQGYDISDYYKIDPRFGTMEDMDELIAEAKKRGISILMDLVVNHCSDEHEWFKKACEDPDGRYGKYFYIRDWDGEHLPTNWRSYFGGPVWEPLPGHPDKVYLHVFHKKQPDLNWTNEVLREEIYTMINWWLDKGLGGFRIDAIINIRKPEVWHDYPADRDDGLSVIFHMLEEAEGIGEYLGEMRDRTFAKYDAFTAGEVFNEKPGELPCFIGENGYFSTMFDFMPVICGASMKGWYDREDITPDQYRDSVFMTQAKAAGIGMVANIIENHDEPRGVSRYIPAGDQSPASKKMLGALSFFLRGIPFIFQGQEIGMENYDFTSIDEVDDINTLDEYQVARNAGLTKEEALKCVAVYSRDNARTPVQWSDEENAGFTTGTPWLHVNPKYKKINVASQVNDPDSVLSFYKEMIALRKNPEYKENIVYGNLTPAMTDVHNLMAYIRTGENQRLFVIGNYQKDAREIEIPFEVKKVLLNNEKEIDYNKGKDGTLLKMSGYQVLVLLV